MGDTKAMFTPGPNQYGADAKKNVQRAAPCYGFGTSKRPQSVHVRKQPGPGAYELKGITGSESQGRSLGQRLSQSKTTVNFNPGPGQYQPSYN